MPPNMHNLCLRRFMKIIDNVLLSRTLLSQKSKDHSALIPTLSCRHLENQLRVPQILWDAPHEGHVHIFASPVIRNADHVFPSLPEDV
mmetsp:Transcript_2911/g.4224  ORF Transcript_2911/g.4224 Transcript_2911/m.4224 type:complete len:88 (-) Transcript_2911:744-1007(-)